MEVEKIFNDSVHGPIRLHPLCVKIIDTPEFQRLRNIKQLGTTYHVYPAASHNRFEHSLGVCYLAGRMVNALRENKGIYSAAAESSYNCEVVISDEDKLCVEIAGLCHDIGHGPFSHLWELVLAGCGVKWRHEDTSAELFDYLLVKNNLIDDFESYGINAAKRNFIKELILGKDDCSISENRFLYQIVANKDNDIDVDKWDYFLRDGLQMNLKITFDYNRLLQFCCVVKDPDNETHRVIAFRNKEADNLHDMFRVRADLHRKAYQHTVVKNIDLMYIDVFIEADKHYKFQANQELVSLSNAHKNLRVFSRLTDHVFENILNDPNPDLKPVQNLIDRIQTRKLYSHIGTYVIKVVQVCSKVDVYEVKEKLNSYFNEKFHPHELRFCPIKLDYVRHIEGLKKVNVFSKRNLTKLTKIDVTKIFGPLPLEDAYSGITYMQIHAYCRTYNLDPEISKEMDNEIRNGLFNEGILNNNNNKDSIGRESYDLLASFGDGGGRRAK